MAHRSSLESDNNSSSDVVTGISAYDQNFAQHIRQNGVFAMGQVTPSNLNQIQRRMTRRRSSLTLARFPESTWRNFREAMNSSSTQAEIFNVVMPVLMGDHVIPHGMERLFNNLQPALRNGKVQLNGPKPDWFDGHTPSSENQDLRQRLGRYIVPSKNASLPFLPNFFIEVKGPNGVPDQNRLQVIHAGIFGARGMQRLRAHALGYRAAAVEKPGQAILVTYCSTTIEISLIHTAEPTLSNWEVEYHVTHLGIWNPGSSIQEFRKAASALRNLRDWAKDERDYAIENALSRTSLEPSEESAGRQSSGVVTALGAKRKRRKLTSAEVSFCPLATTRLRSSVPHSYFWGVIIFLGVFLGILNIFWVHRMLAIMYITKM